MSRILNKKQGLSVLVAKEISLKLDFDQRDTQIFCLLVQSQDARSKLKRVQANSKLISYFVNTDIQQKNLSIEDYEILKEWYNIALLELVELSTFKNDDKWIAKQLEINTHQVKISISKLLKLGLIKEYNGTFLRTQKHLNIDPKKNVKIITDFHYQLILKAKESIYLQTKNERHLGIRIR